LSIDPHCSDDKLIASTVTCENVSDCTEYASFSPTGQELDSTSVLARQCREILDELWANTYDELPIDALKDMRDKLLACSKRIRVAMPKQDGLALLPTKRQSARRENNRSHLKGNMYKVAVTRPTEFDTDIVVEHRPVELQLLNEKKGETGDNSISTVAETTQVEVERIHDNDDMYNVDFDCIPDNECVMAS
jgi:hypothetical protein